MTTDEFAHIEASLWEEWELEEQRRLDAVRVKGAMLWLGARVDYAHASVERAISLVQNAQSVLDKAQKSFNSEVDLALKLAALVGRGDPDEFERIARVLEDHGF